MLCAGATLFVYPYSIFKKVITSFSSVQRRMRARRKALDLNRCPGPTHWFASPFPDSCRLSILIFGLAAPLRYSSWMVSRGHRPVPPPLYTPRSGLDVMWQSLPDAKTEVRIQPIRFGDKTAIGGSKVTGCHWEFTECHATFLDMQSTKSTKSWLQV